MWQSTSTPLVGGVKDKGDDKRRLHSQSVDGVKSLGSSVAEEVAQLKHQSSIEAWLSVRVSGETEAPLSMRQPALRKTVPLLSQGRSDEGRLTKKTPSSQGSLPAGSAADTQPPAHKASVVRSSWQLTKPNRDSQSEPNKTAILLKPWQPSHAGHVMAHDSDVSDDESV